MPVVPKNPADQITFYASHVRAWGEDPGAIGLTSATTAAIGADVAAAEAALAAARGARDQARAATLVYRSAVRTLHARGSAAIATIKAFAQSTDNPFVYGDAQIDPPRRGGPAPKPATPFNLTVTISGSGSLTLSWEAETSGPSTGVFFQVYRRDASASGSSWTLLASTALTSHVDPAPLAGTSNYMLIAARGRDRSQASTAIAVILPGGGAPAASPSIAHPLARRAA